MDPHITYSLSDLASFASLAYPRHKQQMLINGCFDHWHPGHIDLFSRAQKYRGDLFVSINDDQYIRDVKQREPIPVYQRIENILQYHPRVIYVNTEHTVTNVLRACRFNLWIKGITYLQEDTLDADEVEAARQAGTDILFISSAYRGHSTNLVGER